MFRNQYDTDVTTYSPDGRIHQVEYAMEAVKQGAACVGLRSNDYVVVATLKRSSSDLASYQKKIFKIDEHMGIAISGLIADARSLSLWMRNECLNHKYVYETPIQAGRLVIKLSDKSQVYTQKDEKRPYGVGLLVAAFDKTGPHLFQTMPSGNYSEYKAIAMGARSQAAKTYLERHFETFGNLSLDELIKHALVALKGTAQGALTAMNVAIGIVGRDKAWTTLEDDAVKPYVAQVADEEEKKDDDDKDGKDGKDAKDKKKGASTAASGGTAAGTDKSKGKDKDGDDSMSA
jgi:20S proteasome subunit alpha 6